MIGKLFRVYALLLFSCAILQPLCAKENFDDIVDRYWQALSSEGPAANDALTLYRRAYPLSPDASPEYLPAQQAQLLKEILDTFVADISKRYGLGEEGALTLRQAITRHIQNLRAQQMAQERVSLEAARLARRKEFVRKFVADAEVQMGERLRADWQKHLESTTGNADLADLENTLVRSEWNFIWDAKKLKMSDEEIAKSWRQFIETTLPKDAFAGFLLVDPPQAIMHSTNTQGLPLWAPPPNRLEAVRAYLAAFGNNDGQRRMQYRKLLLANDDQLFALAMETLPADDAKKKNKFDRAAEILVKNSPPEAVGMLKNIITQIPLEAWEDHIGNLEDPATLLPHIDALREEFLQKIPDSRWATFWQFFPKNRSDKTAEILMADWIADRYFAQTALMNKYFWQQAPGMYLQEKIREQLIAADDSTCKADLVKLSDLFARLAPASPLRAEILTKMRGYQKSDPNFFGQLRNVFAAKTGRSIDYDLETDPHVFMEMLSTEDFESQKQLFKRDSIAQRLFEIGKTNPELRLQVLRYLGRYWSWPSEDSPTLAKEFQEIAGLGLKWNELTEAKEIAERATTHFHYVFPKNRSPVTGNYRGQSAAHDVYSYFAEGARRWVSQCKTVLGR